MKIKRIASIAIIAALPFTANATQTIVTTQTPAAVGANGTVNIAATSGPYQTATIGEHDDEHIATTAYVKGAYNDAIAAVNKVDSEKQTKLISSYGWEADSELRPSDDFLSILKGENGEDIRNYEDTIVSMAGVGAGINYALTNIDSKRVKIYTTWDDDRDSATTLVEFATAQQ